MTARPHTRRGILVACTLAGCLAGTLIPLPSSGGKAAPKPPGQPENTASFTRGMAITTGNEDAFSLPITTERAGEFAQTNPQAFLRWILDSDPQPSPEIVEAFFTAWVAKDPDAALGAALRLPARFGYDIHSQFFPRMVQLLFQTDPLTALRWVGRIEGAIGHDITLHVNLQTFAKLAPLDPEEIRMWLNHSPVGGVSVGMAKTYAEMLAEKDVEAAIRWSMSLNVEYQNAVMPMMMLHFARENPQAALNYIENAPSNIRQYAAGFALLSEKSMPARSMLQWMEDEMGIVSYTGLQNIMTRFYNENPKDAVAYVAEMEGTIQGFDAARGLAEAACLGHSTEDAVKMIATLPASMQLEAARSAMFMRMPADFPAFIEPLVNGTIEPANVDGYMDILVSFMDGERGTSFGRDSVAWSPASTMKYLESFQNWIRDHPGAQRDLFIRKTAESLQGQPGLRDDLFRKIPADELQRILGN